jgi:hypothetical protein
MMGFIRVLWPFAVIVTAVLHICVSTVRDRSKDELWAHLKSKDTQLKELHGAPITDIQSAVQKF